MDLKIWAEQITKEIYEKWKNEYSFWEPGIKVFYGPVKSNPAIMILTMQPGEGQARWYGEDKYRFESGDFSPPKINAYIENSNRMARRMQNLFKENIRLLEVSVTIPIIFFRAPNVKEWKSLDRFTRMDIERFSLEKVKKIIETVKPKGILVHGNDTFNRLKELLGIKVEHRIRSNIGDIVRKAEYGDIKIFGMAHPTGARISKENWKVIKEEFIKFYVSIKS